MQPARRRNLLGQIPGQQRVGTPQALRPLRVVQFVGVGNLGVAAQDLSVHPGEFRICRVAHRYQPLHGHRPPSSNITPAGMH